MWYLFVCVSVCGTDGFGDAAVAASGSSVRLLVGNIKGVLSVCLCRRFVLLVSLTRCLLLLFVCHAQLFDITALLEGSTAALVPLKQWEPRGHFSITVYVYLSLHLSAGTWGPNRHTIQNVARHPARPVYGW